MGSLHTKCTNTNLTKNWALTVLIANCIIPGSGTFIAGALTGEKLLINNTIVAAL